MFESQAEEPIWDQTADEPPRPAEPHRSCGRGHRSSLLLPTPSGGSICLVCLSNLLSDPSSPLIHVSYALSQLSSAVRSSPSFLAFHSRLLVAPLSRAISSFNDDPIARQTVDVVSDLCGSGSDGGDGVSGDFIARFADLISSGALAWSRRQVYTLHCFGVVLDRHRTDSTLAHIRDKASLVSNLVEGLQLPSEEIRGEVLFVLYKLSLYQDPHPNRRNDEPLLCHPKLLHLSLEALLKTQSDDVRNNCIALLTVLAQRGCFQDLNHDEEANEPPLIVLFADAIKGSLLSSDTQVQIGALDLIFHSLSSGVLCLRWVQVLVEESVADYIFEILRLSENKDSIVVSCMRVLELLSMAEDEFMQRLAIGFTTLISALHYVSEIPLHPVQSHTLKLVLSCMSSCPGIVSMSHIEELATVLAGMFRKHTSGELGMLSETFMLACSTIVELLRSPSAQQIKKLAQLVHEAARNAVFLCLSVPGNSNPLLLYSLHLLKEAFTYSHQGSDFKNVDLVNGVIEICETYILPWLGNAVDEGEEEEIILGVLETFHSILLQGTDVRTRKFAEVLVSSSWFSLSFGCLGLFPSNQMKCRVYLMLGSVIDRVLGHDLGQPIRDAYLHLPSDPLDLLFLLGQKSSNDYELISCQAAVLLILYVSSLYDERLADINQVLASLEQHILINSRNISCGISGGNMFTQLVNLYGYSRGDLLSSQMHHSSEAERLLFHLISEQEWDLLSMRIHPKALMWLFQQDRITGPLSNQILNFCRHYNTRNSQIDTFDSNTRILDIQTVSELIARGDNCGASLLVSLLKQLLQENQEEDISVVLDVMVAILNINPQTSNHFCIHGISDATYGIYHSGNQSHRFFKSSLLLVFNLLNSVHPETLSSDETWLPVTLKLLEFVALKLSSDPCEEDNLVMAILTIILKHSFHHVLVESSKAILLSSSLAAGIEYTVNAACAKGPALINHDEETNTGKTLLFVLLLYFFSLRRLIHYGSSSVKLIASHCLVELLIRISDQSINYLQSVIAVLEGLVFYGDIGVAMNCSICLSMILGWGKLSSHEKRLVTYNKWFRVVIEELALSLVAPGLASKSFTNQHKPAAHIAIALLRLDKVPGWMRSVFDQSCLSGIVNNLSAINVSAEMVELFRELVEHEYMNSEQIAVLNHVFQGCRKNAYKDSYQEINDEVDSKKVISIPDDLGNVCRILIHLMMSHSIVSKEIQTERRRLLEEIELFSQDSSPK
ncbi:Protein PRD1 [Acorus gramineus]|uniref:Protein PRD1 n=1 Tax=Acorus gramineus TaxID=55184 RepID=A0AAV8ZY51_ACOGR|nr:Protein PRD1 [Acorus gramineus]